MERPRRPRSGRPAATLPVLPHTGRTERGPAYQAIEPAGQVLPAGRAVHPAPLGYSRVRRRFDRLGRPAVGRDYDTTSLPSRPAPGTPFPAPSQSGCPTSEAPDGSPRKRRLLRRCQRWGVAGAALDTVAFAQGSVRQPPSLVAQAKEMGRRRRLPGKSPNSVRPVRSDWPRPVAQCFAASLAEDNGVSGPTGIVFRL